MNSLSTMELFTLLLDRQDLFRSQSILNLLKDVTTHQSDIRGDNRIKKLESLIDTLKRQNEESTLQQQVSDYKQDETETSSSVEEPTPIQPVEVKTEDDTSESTIKAPVSLSDEIPTETSSEIQPTPDVSLPPSDVSGKISPDMPSQSDAPKPDMPCNLLHPHRHQPVLFSLVQT